MPSKKGGKSKKYHSEFLSPKMEVTMYYLTKQISWDELNNETKIFIVTSIDWFYICITFNWNLNFLKEKRLLVALLTETLFLKLSAIMTLNDHILISELRENLQQASYLTYKAWKIKFLQILDTYH